MAKGAPAPSSSDIDIFEDDVAMAQEVLEAATAPAMGPSPRKSELLKYPMPYPKREPKCQRSKRRTRT